MNDSGHFREPCDDGSIDAIEALVRSAGNYIQPTDDLRPATLEAAREQRSQQKAQHRLGGWAIAVVLLALLGFPARLMHSSALGTGNPSFATTDEVQRRALSLSADMNVEPGWALMEVFIELRHDRAELLNDSK